MTQQASDIGSLPLHLPDPNCYWVLPGKLMAGGYPRREDDESATTRIQAFTSAGVNCFYDLTQWGELKPYADLLGNLEVHSTPVSHRRFPIPDLGVPPSTEALDALLDNIELDLAGERVVYVHCRAGVGRTGIVIAAFLVRQGCDVATALAMMSGLRQSTKRMKKFPRSPSLEGQLEWLHCWAMSKPPFVFAAKSATLRARIGLDGFG